MEEYDALVTGGTGFLWQYILAEPLCARFRICFLGRRPPEHGARFEFVDLSAAEAADDFHRRSLHSPLFIHFAATTPRAGVEIPVAKADRIAINAAAIALTSGARRLIHASSGAVCGIDWPGERSEEDAAVPATGYGCAKRSAENLLDSCFADAAAGRHVTHLRLHFPAPSLDALRRAAEEDSCDRLFARLARDLLHGRPIRLESRSFRLNPCPGAALAEFLRLMLEDHELTPGRINVAGGRHVTLAEIVRDLARQLGRSPQFEYGDQPDRSMLADTRKFRALVGDIIDHPLFQP